MNQFSDGASPQSDASPASQELKRLAAAFLPTSSYDHSSRKLTIRGAATFPKEILEFADEIEILDMSQGQMDDLPDDFSRLSHLRVVFFSNNDFRYVPEVLSSCSRLTFLGMKSCRIDTIPDNSLPESLRWLTLTANAISSLPDSIGRLSQLEKLLLSGNQLNYIPESLQACRNLALLRLAANRLASPPPAWLFELPLLAWYGDSGNPFSDQLQLQAHELANISLEDLNVGEKIGQSAWNSVYAASYQDRAAALKLYGGAVTSDGRPADDMKASLAAGQHPNLIPVLGKLTDSPGQQPGLLMSRIPETYRPVGLPPDFDSISRDTYPEDRNFTHVFATRVLQGVASAAAHLHEQGIMHGDIYAHNVLADAAGHAYLADLGAASFYDKKTDAARESIDVRAFGHLIDELTSRPAEPTTGVQSAHSLLKELKLACLDTDPTRRPSFTEISADLSKLTL